VCHSFPCDTFLMIKRNLYYSLRSFVFVYTLNNVNIQSSSLDSQSKPDPYTVAPCLVLGVDAPLYNQSGDVVETPTTTFVDAATAVEGSPSIQTVSQEAIYDDELSLRHFFRRPVEIANGTWTVNGELDLVFNPWQLWSTNSRISNRLNNFRTFNGDLKVKLVINGNPMAWGCALMSYCPCSNPSFPMSSDVRYFAPSAFFPDIMQASQRMHVLIDASTSTGGELSIPMHALFDGHDLMSTRFNNWGEVWLRSLNTLRQLSSTKALSYTVYAWCENVKLSGATQTNMQGLAAQSGDEQQGSLSQSLGIISKIAASAKMVPVIGKWMTAAEMAAKLGSDMAFAMGFSKPTDEAPFIRNVDVLPHMSPHDGVDTCRTLGTSTNQQMPVDPSVVGFSGDMMNFAEIAKIPSLIDVVNWLPSDARNTILFSMPVTPMLNEPGTRPLLNATALQLTPMGFVASNFRYWRGSLKVRLQIVANAFHRGRLLVVWDAVGSPSSPQEQVTKCMIVDVAENRDFEFDVGWSTFAPLCRTAITTADMTLSRCINAAGQTANTNFHNGVITVYVLNELVTNVTSTTAVGVNVWVSMPDLEVAEPYFEHMKQFALYPAAPTVALLKEELPAVEEEPLDLQAGVTDSEEFVTKSFPDLVPKVPNTTVGYTTTDVTRSFRKLLKRYNFVRFVRNNITFAANEYTWFRDYHATTPVAYGPGYNISGWDGTGTNKRKQIPLTPIVWATQGYTYWKGSVRMGVLTLNTQNFANISVYRGYELDTPFSSVGTTPVANAPATLRTTDRSADGYVHIADARLQTIEVPYASTRRFHPTTLTTTTDTTFENSVIVVEADRTTTAAGVADVAYKLYMGAGEDFNLFWFRGTPCLYYYSPV